MIVLLLFLVGVAAGVAVLAIVGWLVARPSPAAPTRDLCEVCGAPATHELGGKPRRHAEQGGWSAMVATYCRKDAPDGAVKVR